MTARPSAHRQALDALGRGVVGGRWAPGGSLPPEPLLGDELAVSRTVVREAVKSLAAKGLVVTGPKLGTRVLSAEQWNWFDPDVVAWQAAAGLTRAFLRDVQELRRVIEPAAVAMAAERATRADIATLEAAWHGMQRAIAEGGDYVGHDLAFHLALLHASHNRMVVQMGKALGALLRASFEISTRRPDAAAQSLPLHRAVLDAVVARDVEGAARACRRLIDAAADDIDRVLASRRKLPSLARPARPLRPASAAPNARKQSPRR